VAVDQLDARVGEIAQALVNAGPAAVQATKKLVHDVAEKDISPELIRMTVESIADVRVSPEGREGLQSFLQKRKPGWSPA